MPNLNNAALGLNRARQQYDRSADNLLNHFNPPGFSLKGQNQHGDRFEGRSLAYNPMASVPVDAPRTSLAVKVADFMKSRLNVEANMTVFRNMRDLWRKFLDLVSPSPL